ncbi:hypothetical protein Q5M85_03600 [Paraclostridium bifermentans]|nr:hypothetical protein [Paraclostridium bifermentans]
MQNQEVRYKNSAEKNYIYVKKDTMMMDTLVTGINNDILKICTNEFSLYFRYSENKKFKATNNNKNIEATLDVESIYDDLEVYSIN